MTDAPPKPADEEGGSPEFWQDRPEYHGVLAVQGDARLIVSPNGKRYLLQVRDQSGSFDMVTWRKSLAKLLPSLPPGMAEKLPELPDDPADYERPWAAKVQAQSQRLLRASLTAEEYAGVIARSGDVRLVISPERAKYILQTRRPSGRWEYTFSSASRGPIFELVFNTLPPDHKAAAASRNRALMTAVARLPERASSFTGARPERLGEVVAQVIRPRRPETT